jgi:hypothetical protein
MLITERKHLEWQGIWGVFHPYFNHFLDKYGTTLITELQIYTHTFFVVLELFWYHFAFCNKV